MKIIQEGKIKPITVGSLKRKLVSENFICRVCGGIFAPEENDFLKPRFDLNRGGLLIGYLVPCPMCLNFNEVQKI